MIHASPDGLQDQEIRDRIIKSSHALLTKSGDAWVDKLGTAIANEKGSTESKEIVVQAANGRVDTLLLGNF